MRHMTMPMSIEDRKSLHYYDQLLLDGVIYVGRDQAHSRLCDLLDKGEKLPFDIEGQFIYYMGPSPAPEGFIIGSCGPTTSARMDPFAPRLLDLGMGGMIGKGPRSKAVVEAIKRNSNVYLAAFGGCGALYGSCVLKKETIAFPELGPEALLRLEIKDFPVIVAIDCEGNSVYDR